MRPPALDLKSCRVKKVFTNNVNTDNPGAASGSERSPLELEFGGLSPARLSIFNLEEPFPSPTLERPLRIRRRSTSSSVLSGVSGDNSMTSNPSHIAPRPRFIYSGPPLLMNPDGSVKSPHRTPNLIIKSTIKKVCPRKTFLKPLSELLSAQRYRVLYTIVEEPEEE
ncbi:uncharacterized protein MELLADRAFT_84470 [Melampsora larici-populina 98AG31]|uniref:Uncharacterized protein n=1 Tax=Melampsora larici-populina (strain 98AG31 / pathotype 3-4-7) TaxID=747676 RepID=F4SC38_MELLP|nr:uncharacterized protein MELLADRAFT_84470 [Melampsora larici-populina 98AG31]EGF97784.1 hypothetical protein MELLADRAFT_84470 [Melampsora larici-populina 98AG31]